MKLPPLTDEELTPFLREGPWLATIATHNPGVALPDKDLEVGVPAELYEYYGLTVNGVVAKALELAKG